LEGRKERAVKKSRYSEEQISYALKQAATGTPVAEVLRRMGISEQTFYRWKKLYGGLGVGELRRLRQLEDENRKLKQLVADLSLDKHILQEVLSKKSEACSTARDCPVCAVGLWGQRAAQLRCADL
jgi:putative transposase